MQQIKVILKNIISKKQIKNMWNFVKNNPWKILIFCWVSFNLPIVLTDWGQVLGDRTYVFGWLQMTFMLAQLLIPIIVGFLAGRETYKNEKYDMKSCLSTSNRNKLYESRQ